LIRFGGLGSARRTQVRWRELQNNLRESPKRGEDEFLGGEKRVELLKVKVSDFWLQSPAGERLTFFIIKTGLKSVAPEIQSPRWNLLRVAREDIYSDSH
jgi:hypothetical protein